MEKRKEDHTSVLLLPEANLQCDKKKLAATNDFTGTSDEKQKRSKKSRVFRIIIVWVVCSVLGLFSLNKAHQLYANKCVEDWGKALDYPDSFPRRDELLELEMMTQRLAIRHGKEFLGKCYQTMMLVPIIRNSTLPLCDDANASGSYSEAEAPSSAEATVFSAPAAYDDGPVQPIPTSAPSSGHSSNALDDASKKSIESFLPPAAPRNSAPVTPYDPEVYHTVSIENAQVLSLAKPPVIRNLKVSVADGIDVYVDILTAAQAGQSPTEAVDIYLRPCSDDGVNIFQLVELQARSFFGIIYVTLDLKPGVPAGSTAVKCLLQIVIPDTFSSNVGSSSLSQKCLQNGLRLFELRAKEGRIKASHMVLNSLSIELGRGVVDIEHVDIGDLRVAVLDGDVYLGGIRTKRSLAAGVLRGSSTVLAQIHPEDNTYAVINMCADGYTYTNVMTTEKDHEKFAANLHIYRETGTRLLEQPAPVMAHPGHAHLDTNSTDVHKTGYMVAPNSGSDILVYAGAKSAASRITKSRFLYGYYNEEASLPT
ncbi:hypothetical protein BDB00DRAFT_809287 [Zychaea mexicana]|uniref:uncharacterized protein n=1 Tax=Zychaea mexicana TaxID=64656 RepID=UPI0022FE6381|nr:uncharacterized protein BDB00DRAFT_809287 [Zychaea mexicana]KAI9496544.1 hypothetical protein BDB00DRAFT_809287 [Zychaea mexicana]